METAKKIALKGIIEEKILPKPSQRKLYGFQRSVGIPLLDCFSDEEAELILTNFSTFQDLLVQRIEASIKASFPEIRLRREKDHTIILVIGDSGPNMAAEWRWK